MQTCNKCKINKKEDEFIKMCKIISNNYYNKNKDYSNDTG